MRTNYSLATNVHVYLAFKSTLDPETHFEDMEMLTSERYGISSESHSKNERLICQSFRKYVRFRRLAVLLTRSSVCILQRQSVQYFTA